ncbi:4327_t:CDS:1, partial [Cetraspora pellucida]
HRAAVVLRIVSEFNKFASCGGNGRLNMPAKFFLWFGYCSNCPKVALTGKDNISF